MSKNVFSIIYVVLGKFKRKFSNKIGFEPYIHEPTILNKNNICYDSNEISSQDNSDEEIKPILEIKIVVHAVTAARWKHQLKVFVVLKYLMRDLTQYIAYIYSILA